MCKNIFKSRFNKNLSLNIFSLFSVISIYYMFYYMWYLQVFQYKVNRGSQLNVYINNFCIFIILIKYLKNTKFQIFMLDSFLNLHKTPFSTLFWSRKLGIITELLNLEISVITYFKALFKNFNLICNKIWKERKKKKTPFGIFSL